MKTGRQRGAAFWRTVREWYEGTEAGVAERRDSPEIRLIALSRRFEVSVNTIESRVKSRGWRRPWWYASQARSHPARVLYGSAAEIDRVLTDLLRRVVRSGSAMPTNADLARELDTSDTAVAQSLLRLKQAGRVEIESHGNRRRLRLTGGKAWTALTTLPQLAPAPVATTGNAEEAAAAKPAPPPAVDPALVRSARDFLTRRDVIIYDRWILSGDRQERGRRWCVNGATLDAAGVLREAAARGMAVSPTTLALAGADQVPA